MKKQKINYFKDIVKRVSMESTCTRVSVGAILVRDQRIIATGWNGVPAEDIHCKDFFKDKSIELHAKFSEENELHAEQNLLAFCAKNGIMTNDSILFLTISPCIHCAKLLVSSGIKEVYYIEEYDRDQRGIDFLIDHCIVCKKIVE
ncbi:MAG: deoxycytidylate deaminase [Minisyncoccales bacterium]